MTAPRSSPVALRVAAIQMPVTADVAANEAILLDALSRAADRKAAILVSPEGCLSGYYPGFDQALVASSLGRIVAKASSLSVGLAQATCFREKDGLCYNQVRVYTRDGAFQGFHSKILRCSSLDAPGTGELADYAATGLRTFTLDGTVFGCLICSDLWATPGWNVTPNPYLAWQLKRLGARFILHSVNSGSDQRYRQYHEANLSLWAMALRIPIVTVNASPPDGTPNSVSGVLGPDGNRLLTVAGTGTEYFDFDLALT